MAIGLIGAGAVGRAAEHPVENPPKCKDRVLC